MPVDESDPIDLALHQRKQSGSADTTIKKIEAENKNIKIPEPLDLQVEQPNENLLTVLTPEIIANDEKKAAQEHEEE